MKITLIQPVQNALYDFAHESEPLGLETALALKNEMIEQSFALMEQVRETDLIVTTEAINYPGRKSRLSGDYADHVDESALLARLSNVARRKACYVVAGLYARRGADVVNEAAVFDRKGKLIMCYNKIHLPGEEQATIRPGTAYCTVDADFGRLGVCICWDMQFPEVCRHYALSGAHLVVCPTWGWESIYAHARAYENGIYVAGAMAVPYRDSIRGIRTPSEVVAPDGSVVARAANDRAQALTCEVDLNAMRELYTQRMHDRQPHTYGALTKRAPFAG